MHTVVEEESLNESEISPQIEKFSEEEFILQTVLETLVYQNSLILSD